MTGDPRNASIFARMQLLETKVDRLEARLLNSKESYINERHYETLVNMPMYKELKISDIKFNDDDIGERTRRKDMQTLCTYGYVIKKSNGRFTVYVRVR